MTTAILPASLSARSAPWSGGAEGASSGKETSQTHRSYHADNALSGQTNQRPNQIMEDPYVRTGNQWLNPAAFQAPAPGTYGNVPINGFVGPGAFNVDMGITRSFHTGGNREIQFRAELFNVLNTVQKLDPLTPPNAVASLNSPTFGQITAAADPRIVQLALKYVF